MTAKATPLDLIAIRQHILKEFGIVSWAIKTQPQSHLVSSFGQCYRVNDTKQILLEYQPVVKTPLIQEPSQNPINQVTVWHEAIQNQPNNTFPTQDLNHQINHQTVQAKMIDKTADSIQDNELIIQDKQLPKALMGVKADIQKFHLSGICYGHWLILMDYKQCTIDEKAIWQSLVHTLSQNPNTRHLDIEYPLVVNEYPEYETFLQGTHSLLGFLLQLCAKQLTTNQPILNLAILTPLTVGIELGNLKDLQKAVPSLNEMALNQSAKKVFWQLLHTS